MFSPRHFGTQHFAARHFTGSVPGEQVVTVDRETLFSAGGRERLADALRRKRNDEVVIAILAQFVTKQD